MVQPRRFLFDTSFDALAPLEPDAAPAPPPPPARFTAEQLAQARQEGFAEGHAAGQAAAQAGIEQAAARALARIAEETALLLDAREEIERRNARAATATAVAILRKLQPELARRKALAEVEGVLAHCMETMREEPLILVRVHDGLLDALRERLDAIAGRTGYEGRTVIIADETVAPGDCRVEWADGGVERDTARLWRDIEAALERTLGTSPPTAA